MASKGAVWRIIKLNKPFRFRPHTGISRLVTSHLLVLGLAFGAAATVPAFVSPALAQAQPITIGVLDDDKLIDGDNKFQAAVAALKAQAKDIDSKLPAREFMSDAEGKTFDTLVGKDKPTPADTAQLDGVVKAGMGKRAEYNSIIGNPNRSDADNKRFKELQDLMGKNQAPLVTVSRTLDGQIKAQLTKLQDECDSRVNSVIAQIASDKKLTMVVHKSAIFWSAPALDISDEVMKRLNGS